MAPADAGGFRLPLFVVASAITTFSLTSFLVIKNFFRKQSSSAAAAANTASQLQQVIELDAADGDLPSASSFELPYEVFLSFREPDTGTGFTDFLYRSLKATCIRTFRDNKEHLCNEKELGPGVLEAIKQPRVFIPIFSKGYTSSKRCLMVLAKMVESAWTSAEQKTILPIYYNVTPDEVRRQTGVYAEAFSKHDSSGMFTRETVQQWRDALSAVGRFKGWDLNEIRYQGELIEMVVADVIRILGSARFYIPDSLVGIGDHMEAIMGFLDLEAANDVKAIGIQGIPGIGKTTLAMVVYNQIMDHFDASSFLSDIRENSRNPGGLALLQGKLIYDILKRKFEFPDLRDGVNILRERLLHKKVLIILDDVDSDAQLRALAQPDWLAPGSRIIVTTQNGDILSKFGWNSYEVTEMHAHNALRLFCSHAFNKESPSAGYASISWEIVKATGGHPLSIAVMGSLLRNRGDLSSWKAVENKMRVGHQTDIKGKLKIAYDALRV